MNIAPFYFLGMKSFLYQGDGFTDFENKYAPLTIGHKKRRKDWGSVKRLA